MAWWAGFRGVLLSLLIAACIALILAQGPSASELEAMIRPVLLKDCRPEPGEQLGYAVFVLLLPPSVLFFVWRSLREPIDGRRIERSVWMSQVFLAGFFLFTALRLREWWKFFPNSSGIVLAVAAVLLLRKHRAIRRLLPGPLSNRSRLSEVLAWSGATTLTALSLIHAIFTESALMQASTPAQYHFSFFIDEVAAIASGKTVLVDFFPQYVRMLPYLVEPILGPTGISIFSYSILMALLNGVSLVCGWVIIRRVTASPMRALAYFAAIAGLFAYQQENVRYFSTFSYHALGPFRIFLPMASLLALSTALRAPSKGLSAVSSLLSSIALLNNPDFGLPTWVAVATTLALFGAHPVRSLLGSIAGLIAVLAAFVGITWSRSGALPDLSVALEFQRLFANSGFYMLRLPAVGLYQWVFAVFFSAMMIASTRRVLGETSELDRHRNGMLLATGMMGVGCLMYFIGRSHWSVTTATFWIFSICLVLVCEEFWSHTRGNPLTDPAGSRTTRIPSLILSALLLAGVSTMPLGGELKSKLSELQDTGGDLTKRLDSTSREILSRSHSRPVALIFPFGHLVAARAGVRNVSPFAQEGSIISQAQLQRLGRAIEKGCVTLVAFEKPEDDLLEMLALLGFQQSSLVEGISFWERPLSRTAAPCTGAAAGG